MFSSSCFSLSGLMWMLKNMGPRTLPWGTPISPVPIHKTCPQFLCAVFSQKGSSSRVQYSSHQDHKPWVWPTREHEKHHQKSLISQEKQLLWFLCYQDFFSSLFSLLIKTLHSCTLVYMQRWNLIRYLDTKVQVVLLANSPVSVLITTKAAGKQPNQNDCSKSQQSYKGKCVQNNDPSCW